MPTATAMDARVLAGMKAQLDTRAAKLAAGARRLGWKAGFGAPAALEKLQLAGPLMGYLLQEGRVASGDTVSLAGWTKPVAEPEIAIWLGADLAGGDDRAEVARAISGIGPAIELADLDPPPEDVARILTGNIFHRRVILGRCDSGRGGARLDGVTGIVSRNGAAGPAIAELEANTGRLLDIVAHMASTLRACGERLGASDVIIAGSVVPPIFLDPSDREIAFRLDPLGAVSVGLAR